MGLSSNDVRCTQKPRMPPSACPALLKDNDRDVVESSDDNVGAAIDICDTNATAYKRIGIEVIMDQIQCVQNPLREADPAHAADLVGSFHHHGFYYSPALISVTSVQPVVELFDPYDLLNSIKKRQMVLHEDFLVGAVDGRHHLNLFNSLPHSTYMALQSMSCQICVS